MTAPDAWAPLVGDSDNPGLLALFSVAVLGPAGTAVTRCQRDNTIQVFTDTGSAAGGDRPVPDLATLVRGAVQHLHSYHPELFTPEEVAP